MKPLVALLLSSSLLLAAAADDGKIKNVQVEATGTPVLTLRGKDARQQLLVTAAFENAALRDYTHKAAYLASPDGIVKVDANGVVLPSPTALRP